MFDTLKNYLRRTLGTRRTIRLVRSASNPAAIAHTLDAAALSDILRSSEMGDMRQFFALARDIVGGHGHTQTEFGKRKRAVLNETQTVAPKDKDDPAQVSVAKAIEANLDDLPNWQPVLAHLLNSTIYPLAVVEKVYKASTRPGWRWEISALVPVPYHLLDFSKRGLHIYAQNEEGEVTGQSFPADPTRYIVHRGHLLTDVPDTWGGPFRAILFWWLFATMGRDWWARFLDRFGAPFLEGRYDENDDESRVLLEAAFSAASRLLGVVVPNDTAVSVHQVNTQGAGDAFEKFHQVANREISKIIVGQTLSSDAQSLGLGGGQAGLQGDVLDDLRKFDSTQLASCLRTQLFAPLCQLNGWQVPTPTIWWGGESGDDATVTADTMRAIRESGLELTDEAVEKLSRRFALPLRRAALPPPLGGLSATLRPMAATPRLALNADPSASIDAVAANQATAFAKAMASSLEPLAAIVAQSNSLADLEARLLSTLPGVDPLAARELAVAALGAASVNAALAFPDPIR